MSKKYNAIVTGCDELGFNVFLTCEGENDRKMQGNMKYDEAVKYSNTINYVMKLARKSLLDIHREQALKEAGAV